MLSSRTTALREVMDLVWTEATRFVKVRLATAALLIVVASSLTALGPYALKLIIDGIAGKPPIATSDLAMAVGFYVFSQWLARSVGEIRGFVYARAERRMARTLTERLFGHVLRLPMQFHLNRRTGAVTQTIANGLQGYQMVVYTMMFSLLPVTVEVGTSVAVIGRLHQPVILLLFCAVVICYVIAFAYGARSTATAQRAASSAQVEGNGYMTDSILNCEVIKAHAAEELIEEKARGVFSRTEREGVKCHQQTARNGICVATICAFFLAVTIGYAVHKVTLGAITLGTLVLIINYLALLVKPVETLGYAVQAFSQGLAQLSKVLELTREKTEDFTTQNIVPIRGIGSLEFEGVEARYHSDRVILKDLNFMVPAGTTLGIVGKSGSGKSTIARLLKRTLEPTKGRVRLDGTSLSELPLSPLRTAIAVIPQDTILFNDTVRYNIAFGKPGCSQHDIEEAARIAHLEEFIATLPQGYDTVVGERGMKISGGERQRIAIARAAIARPLVYFFDEATSALDSIAESKVVTNMREIARTTTTIVVAHRLSTLAHADHIIVLDNGEIVERGTHSELVKRGGRYEALRRVQQQGHGGAYVGQFIQA